VARLPAGFCDARPDPRSGNASEFDGMGDTVTIQKNWQELIKPNKLEVKVGSDPEAVLRPWSPSRSSAASARRSATRCAASCCPRCRARPCTAVQIDGVLHEFSSIPGVREDVTDIVLNIKDIAIKMQGEGPKRMVVKQAGPGRRHRRRHPDHRRYRNPQPRPVQICTLDEGAEIRMEFTVNTGKGYVPAERNRPEDAPIGLIPVDSLYSPVARCPTRSRTPARARSSTTTS
jgi:DNA-directed RNA polymerase subunit alpha